MVNRKTPPGSKHPPPALRIRAFELESEVGRLLREGHHELAVLLTQTILELRVEAELSEHLKILGEDALRDAALELLTTFNIGQSYTKRFFERLVNARLSDVNPAAMRELQEHNERRNRIAHAGETIDEDDARASLRAVLAVCALVHELSFQALGLEDVLEEEERQERLMSGELDEEVED
jgi:hypothetical protein